jgi:hypothetical protein
MKLQRYPMSWKGPCGPHHTSVGDLPCSRTYASRAQVGVVALCAWVFAGMLDGAASTEIVGVPVLLAAWAAALALIDRWVTKVRH